MNGLRHINTHPQENHSVLSVIRGGRYRKPTHPSQVIHFWLFCHAALWNNYLFSEAECEDFLCLIAEHFKRSKDHDKNFRRLVERVCLAKRLVKLDGKRIGQPINWLNIHYKDGLANTSQLHKEIMVQRKSVPHYHDGVFILSEAVLRFSQQKDLREFLHYRKTLIELRQFDLLQYYLNTILHVQHFYFNKI